MFKSQFVQFILTFLFGPLGLFYSSIAAAIFWLIFAFVTVPFTAALSAIPIWLFSILTGFFTVSSYNKRMEAMTGKVAS